MPAYAGFASLTDYIDQRCARDQVTRSRLSFELKKHSNYIHCICHGQFAPSRAMADAIARRFGDDPHLARVLAGLEALPPRADRQLREIADLAAALDAASRAEAIKYLEYLKWRKKK